MTLEDALEADRRGDLAVAAARYEECILHDGPSLEAAMNLAVLYWQATDPGMAAAHRFDRAFLAKADRRCIELLDDACVRFAGHTEPRFWMRYIDWADLGEAFEAAECQRLLNEEPSCLVPAMHLFALSQGRQAEEPAMSLLARCRREGTTRASYIASVIEGVLHRLPTA